MTASPRAIATRSSALARRDRIIGSAPSQVLECAGATDQHEVDDDGGNRYDGRSGRERQVVPDADVVVDDVGEQLGLATYDLDGDVVTETEREREDGTGDQGREDCRQRNRSERPTGGST